MVEKDSKHEENRWNEVMEVEVKLIKGLPQPLSYCLQHCNQYCTVYNNG